MAKKVQGANLREEQETVVCIEYFPAKVYAYSSKPNIIKRLKKWLQEYPDEVSLFHEDDYGAEVIVPESWIKIRPPRKRSEEWKAQAQERLKQMREKRREE